MNPSREKEIRDWVRLRYGTANKPFYGLDVAGELLDEIDSLRESIQGIECLYPDTCPGDCDHCKIRKKHARTEDHRNPTGKPRGIRGRK